MVPPSPLPEHLGRDFTVAEAARSGVSRRRLRHPILTSPFHGTRQTSPAENLLETCHSYAVRMHPDEFFCSATAALLHGIPLPRRLEEDTRLHVAVPNPRRGPRSAGVIGHKFVVHPSRGEVVELDGLRLSSAARAWCELAPLLDVTELVIAGDHVARAANRLGGAGGLLATLERHPARRWRPLLDEAIGLVDPGSESPKESELRLILVRAGVRGFRTNMRVPIPATGRSRRIDIAFPQAKVALEYQGTVHQDPDRWRDDMSRVSQLESVGWRVVFVNADDLRRPEELVARIRRVLATRTTR